MIVGVGVDVVDLSRFEASLARTPTLADRLFTPTERDRPLASLAATFAAKEAVAKALGVPRGLGWHDVVVTRDPDGRPSLTVAGRETLVWHVSLAHDGGVAVAMVIAEQPTAERGR